MGWGSMEKEMYHFKMFGPDCTEGLHMAGPVIHAYDVGSAWAGAKKYLMGHSEYPQFTVYPFYRVRPEGRDYSNFSDWKEIRGTLREEIITFSDEMAWLSLLTRV